MFFSHQDNEKKLKALVQEHETLNLAIDTLFNEMGITEQALARFQQIKAMLTPEDLKKIDAEKDNIEKKTKLDLDNVRNPKEMEKRYKERNIPPTWLFVR